MPDPIKLAHHDDVAMRREVVLNAVREQPGFTARMLSHRLLEDTGGPPALMTGALYVPPWTLYNDLLALERRGLIVRLQATSREVLWTVAS